MGYCPLLHHSTAQSKCGPRELRACPRLALKHYRRVSTHASGRSKPKRGKSEAEAGGASVSGRDDELRSLLTSGMYDGDRIGANIYQSARIRKFCAPDGLQGRCGFCRPLMRCYRVDEVFNVVRDICSGCAVFLYIASVICVSRAFSTYHAVHTCAGDAGDKFQQRRNYLKALKYYDKALSLEPNSCEVLLGRAEACIRARLLSEAQHSLQVALDLQPRSPAIHAALAELHLHRRDYSAALATAQEGLALDPDHQKARAALSRAQQCLREQSEGAYDFLQLFQEAEESKTARLLHADYIGPVRPARLGQSYGTSLVAARDVKRDELLLACAARCIVFPGEAEAGGDHAYERDDYLSPGTRTDQQQQRLPSKGDASDPVGRRPKGGSLGVASGSGTRSKSGGIANAELPALQPKGTLKQLPVALSQHLGREPHSGLSDAIMRLYAGEDYESSRAAWGSMWRKDRLSNLEQETQSGEQPRERQPTDGQGTGGGMTASVSGLPDTSGPASDPAPDHMGHGLSQQQMQVVGQGASERRAAAGHARKRSAPLRQSPAIDAARLEAAVHYNGFGVNDEAIGPGHYTSSDPGAMPHGLWGEPSMINHACIGNAGRVFIGDFIFITALCDIPRGEQVLMSYANTTDPYAERQRYLRKWGFQCSCELCREDLACLQSAQAPAAANVDVLRPVVSRVLKMKGGSATAAAEQLIHQLQAATEQLEHQLSGRKWRFALHKPYVWIAMLLEKQQDFAQAAKFFEKAFELFCCPSQQRHLDCYVTVDYALRISKCYSKLGHNQQSAHWLQQAQRCWSTLCSSRELFDYLHIDE